MAGRMPDLAKGMMDIWEAHHKVEMAIKSGADTATLKDLLHEANMHNRYDKIIEILDGRTVIEKAYANKTSEEQELILQEQLTNIGALT